MRDIHCLGGPPRPLLTRAAVTSIALSALFLIVYGSTNWFTAQRPESQVGTWYFTWELMIPYVPLLIVPYMSIDLLFFFAPFLCREERELKVFAQRMAFSILVAGFFFLLIPLKLAWPPRPRLEGWFGQLIEMSCNAPFLMEYPHNLFPTLHITLCLILAGTYRRHTHGLVRVLLQIWFVLIGLSTVLLWQHHVVDVVGGMVLAGFAFYLFGESHHRLPVAVNARIGRYYAAGSAALLAMIPLHWPWGVFIVWPAASLAIVAAGYFGLGPGIYRKSEGRLPLSTRFVLGPILIGQYASLVYYRRQCRAWDQVAPGVLIGRVLNDVEAQAAIQQGVTAVLDLTAEFSAARPFLTTNYLNLPVLDLTRPTSEQLEAATHFISEQAACGMVYVHCKIGYSRSAAVAGAYLMASRQAATIDEAISHMRSVRPSIVIRPEVREAIHGCQQG